MIHIMAVNLWRVVVCVGVFLELSSAQTGNLQNDRKSTKRTCSIRARVFSSNGAPISYAALEVQPDQGDTGLRAGADPAGNVVLPSVPPGRVPIT